MGDQQNLDETSLHDRPWTTDEIRKHSSNWTLAGDVGLFNLLNEFSHQIISRTHEVENEVDSLVHQTKMTSAKINNVINDFHMLSNLQFVENRVYDEEIQEPASENKPPAEKTKEQREAEMLPRITQAIELGLSVLDSAFDRINVNEISDSEDEDISSEGHTILEPKDPYANRPLPYIIGSEDFMRCEYAGLKDLIEDDALSYSEESSISETDETSSDEGEPLPHDDDKFSDRPNGRMSQNISDRLSSSDESELFGSEKEVNGHDSDASLEFKSGEKNIQRTEVDAVPQKESRQSSISSLQSKLKLPQVLPVPKLQDEKEDDGDLFASEDNSDDESPFRRKTGLFTSEVRFGEEKDDDLFGGDLFGKSPEKVKEVPKAETPKAAPVKKLQSPSVQETKKPTLFDNDEDSEDDIFNTLMKTKKPTVTKTSNAGSQDSSEKADTSSTPSSAPSTKPSGNAFDFVTGGGNTDSLFGDDSDGDDLFSTKKTQGKKFEFDSTENDDLFGIVSTKTPSESKPKKKETEKPTLSKKITKDSLFGDSDSSDQEKPIPVKAQSSVPVKAKKETNLFGDDDLDDDIFSQVSSKKPEVKKEVKKLSLFDDEPKPVKNIETKPVKPVEKPKPISLFDDSDEPVSEETKPAEKPVQKPKNSLFEDSEEELPKTVTDVPKLKQNKSSSLFEDSDNFDLFAPKPAVKKVEPTVPVQVTKPSVKPVDLPKAESVPDIPKPVVNIPKAKDEVDGISSSKDSTVTEAQSNETQSSFDVPVDSTNVLNVISKDRVRVAAKRRKPTRQGRLAAIETTDKETKKDTEVPQANANSQVPDDSSDLFSASVTKPTKSEAPKQDYRAQEKKKMNLMSQLISEVASSKIAQKRVAAEEEDEDDVDIFSEVVKKDRSKSSFSFKPPEENGIASMFPIEKTEEVEDANTSKADSFEDDFFSEPSFKNFRSSISDKDPPAFNLDDDDDDDDDLFSAIKSKVLPPKKPEANDSNDLFGEETDIFADVQREKYEMFPNQVYDDEDDDIFSNLNNKSSSNTVSKATNSSVKKVETKQVDAFDDPLTGLLGGE